MKCEEQNVIENIISQELLTSKPPPKQQGVIFHCCTVHSEI
jgi:hypothetical protein